MTTPAPVIPTTATTVRDAMSGPPVTIRPEDTVPEASRLMHSHGFRRLPVVRDGRLISIVTDRDLKQAMPPDATSLSIWEISYLMGQPKVGEIMTGNVLTVPGDLPLPAAALMLQNRTGGLPVVDGHGQVVGILTVTDALRDYVAASRVAASSP